MRPEVHLIKILVATLYLVFIFATTFPVNTNQGTFSSFPPFPSEVPPNLTVPQEKSPLVTREGDIIELQCQVTGKPKPIILWSRADKEIAMPDGSMQMESYDGILRIVNVSREMTGTYRCQTSQYNGFNVKPREALVQLIVQCK